MSDDVDRRRAQEDALAAELDEVDELRVGRPEQEPESVAHLAGAARESGRGFTQRRRRRRLRPAGVPSSANVASKTSSAPVSAAAWSRAPASELSVTRTRSSFFGRSPERCANATSEKNARARSRSAISCLGDLVAGLAIGERLRRGQALGVARQILEPVVADRQAEILRRDVLELVRFVEHEVAARRNHLAVGALADRGVGAQQVMVDDDHVGRGRALAHPGHEALVVARAFSAEAGFGGRRHLVPERQILGQILELGAVAGLGPRGPLPDDRQKDVVGRADRRRRSADRAGAGTDSSPAPSCKRR